MKFRLIVTFLVLVAFSIYSCNPYEAVEIKGADTSFGYVPADFVTEAGLKEFKLLAPQPIVNPGKTLIVNRYLFIGENKRGVHVFDNNDAQNPQPLAFISVFGSVDFLFKNNTLITTNGDDLVAINVSAIDRVAVNDSTLESVNNVRSLFSEITRLNKVFTYPNFPEQQGSYFMCLDSAIYVTEWKLDSVGSNKDCFR